MIPFGHSSVFCSISLLTVVVSCAGCASTPVASDHLARESNRQPPSFDAMVMATIRRNAHNIESEMSPDNVVTVLGLEALGSLEKTMREDGADYRFKGQQCRLIVRTTDTPPLSDQWMIGGTIAGLIGTSRWFFDNTSWIDDVTFERSDGSSVSFAPGETPK